MSPGRPSLRPMSPASSSSASVTTSTTTSRNIVALICLLGITYHLWASFKLKTLSSTLRQQFEDDDENADSKLEAVSLLVSFGRLVALTSAGAACLGFVGTLRSSPRLLRIFSMSGFLSLGIDLLLLICASLLTFANMSSTGFSASLCEVIAHSDLGSMEVFGWSLESCEERWKGLATVLTGFIASVALIRLWASLQVLSYYTALAKRHRRKQPLLSINTHHSFTHYSDAGASRDSPSPSKRSHRIFLLPAPITSSSGGGLELLDMTGEGGGEGGLSVIEGSVPMLEVTPASPMEERGSGASSPISFPPAPSSAPKAPLEEQKFLVYAPVMMTAEQARQLNAREVTCHRARSRSHTSTSSPLSSSVPETSVDLLSPVEEEPASVKGKLA